VVLTNAEKQKRWRDKRNKLAKQAEAMARPRKPIEPDPQDYKAIEREHGVLPSSATVEQHAYRYQLAQAQKLIRLYEHGKLPLALMREMDRIRRDTARK